MKIAVVGAGFAGLASAKVLTEFGHQVAVFDKAPDVGGVWSATRRYTGLYTQNNKGSYSFSDLPMPKHYPEWPSGEQVQAYLEQYVEAHGLSEALRLSTEVVRAELTDAEDGWLVTSRHSGEAVGDPERFDHVVVANGIFSDPVIPAFEGLAQLLRAGGKVVAASQLGSVEDARGKNVVVVGYGKSACDVAAEIGPVAADTHLVARKLLWKVPKKLGNAVNMKYLLLTRLGEALFRYQDLAGVEKFLHGPGNAVRKSMLSSVAAVTTKQLRLKELGLVPRGEFEDIARSTVSLASDALYDQVADGAITVHRDTEVERFTTDDDGAPAAVLSNGRMVRADLVVCGTGFHQRVPFLDQEVTDRLLDDRGNFQLYRQILPHDVPHLTFAGYNSSLFSPLSAEMAAVWTAAHLAGALDLPPVEVRREHVADRVDWMEKRTEGKHARGTNIIPFSLHQVDELLDDLDLNLSGPARVKQWLLPVDPTAYRRVAGRLRTRVTA
ncbi:NAD(P)/FAD-dependent oxidoreductase [Isoptericola halotolerans]|uniref:Cation diffusion facilitator CzcD-associated flavoprotein CzcO n=1 Tax=Isoptericola halotolerans TaxID=300560 RepID=A0ABX2A4L1_9MICO|nr:NAD(P)/FAD-dependent oxidoreductase [Isoptericola halotolerans]NOV97792.1 cation diffusion facilitator CzcD-associated flavoprotein CzcO [Isoptericola halotolerans]